MFHTPTPSGEKRDEQNEEFQIVGNLYMHLKNWLQKIQSPNTAEDFLKTVAPLYIKDNLVDYSSHWSLLEHISITKMYDQIEQKLKVIDVELTLMKMSNSSYYDFICKELLPNLTNNIQSKYSGYANVIPSQLVEHLSQNQNIDSSSKHTESKSNQEMVEIESDKVKLQRKYKIRLMYELGLLEYLQNNFRQCKNNDSEIARILCLLIDEFKPSTIQPYINDVFKHGLSNTNDKDLDIIDIVNRLKY
jgi:hypothetical protein